MKLLEHLKELSLHPKNAQELKGLILQLAVQGKLTAKWREDNQEIESSDIALCKIVKQKEVEKELGRFNRGKLIDVIDPDKTYFELPSSWQWLHIDDVLYYITDYQANGSFATLKANVKYYEHPNYAVLVRLKDLRHDMTKSSDFKYTDEHGYNFLSKSSIHGGELLVANVGAGVGTIMEVPGIDFKATLAPNMFCIYPAENGCNKEYFKHYTGSPLYWSELNRHAKGTGQPKINKSEYRSCRFPLPPLEEQKAIVEVVNTLFAEVEQLESLTKERIQLKESFAVSALNKLTEAKNTQQEWNFLQQHFSSFFTEKKNIKSLRETILQLAVQGKLTALWRANNPNIEPASELLKRIQAEKQQLIAEKKIKKEKPLPQIKEDEMPYELPEGWKFSRLGSIIKISSGDGLTSRNMDKDGSIPVYGGNGITGYHSKFNVSKPEIVIGRVGYYCGSVHLTEEKAWVTDNAFITKFSEQNIYRRYLVWLLKGTNLKEKENATAQPVISGKKIYPIVIGFPPFEEQKVIVEKVDSLMALCDELEQQIEISNIQIEQLMQSCLQEVFEH